MDRVHLLWGLLLQFLESQSLQAVLRRKSRVIELGAIATPRGQRQALVTGHPSWRVCLLGEFQNFGKPAE